MLKTVRRLLGKTKGVMALVLKQGGVPGRMKVQLKKAIGRIKADQGVILLTDIYGSTQCNVCMKFLKKGEVEMITGFNLPLVVKLVSLNRSTPLKKLIRFVEGYGKSHILRIADKNVSVKPFASSPESGREKR